MTKKEILKKVMKDKNIKPVEAFLTTHEMAKLLGVTCTTVIAWCNKGLIKYSKTIGGHRRMLLSEYERLSKESMSNEITTSEAETTSEYTKTETKKNKTQYPINKYKKIK